MNFFLTFLFCALCFLPKPADAQETLESQVSELKQLVQQLQQTVERQQNEINSLKVASSQPQPIDTKPVNQIRDLVGGSAARWMPEIGVVADAVLMLDSPKADAEGADRLSMRELELVLGSAVDPYSRLDATISFSDFEVASLEEAYYTHFELPWDFTGRIGKLKPRIGKAIPMHRDSLDTVDEPLVIQKYFGTEGYNRSGADVTKILDLPWPSAHQLSFGVLEGGVGEGGTAFGSTRRRPTIYSHLKNFWNVSDAQTFELGASHLIGSKDADAHFEVNVLGLDATWVRHLNSAQTFKLQGECLYMNREETFTFDEGTLRDLNNLDGTPWGAYLLGDFRISTRWATGMRLDYAELVDNPVLNPHKADIGYTGYLTLHQSEFARWRLQLTHVDLATGKDDNRVMLQGTFAIGEHKHKIT